jgi:hypothetical protein
MGVKPTDKEISSFRKYLKKQGFTEDGLCKGVFFLYMKYGYLCVSIEDNKKGEFKEVRAFLSLAWENSKCSRFYFPTYYNFGGVRKLDRDYVDKCTSASTQVMVAINDVLEKIESITTTLKNVLKR